MLPDVWKLANRKRKKNQITCSLSNMQLKDQYQLVILGYFICLGISIDIRHLVANTKFKIPI